MKVEKIKISELKVNPNNPRIIKDDKFKKLVQSIIDFPEMLEIRPIVCNKDMLILGGNMRFKAAKEAGLKDVPVIIAELSEKKQQEFLIKDNVSGGEWDWDILANEWDLHEISEWGLSVPGIDFDGELKDSKFYENKNKVSVQTESMDEAMELQKKLLEMGYKSKLS